jgi:hypothetical protein
LIIFFDDDNYNFKNFLEFFKKVDVINGYEEDWTSDKIKELRPYYFIVWNELKLKLMGKYFMKDKKEETISITTEYPKDRILEQIENLLCTAIEMGVSAYWVRMYEKGVNVKMGSESLYYIKRELTLGEIEASSDNGKMSKKLNEENLLIGLNKMATSYPRHFLDMVMENDDGDTADIFLQCCILGEVVYG